MSFLSTLIKKLRAAKYQPPSAITAIDALDLKRRLDTHRDLVVLDVRNADEYAGPLGHIAGAINFALVDLPARSSELAPYRGRSIAVVCLSDKRSTQAIQLLRDAGFSDVLLLRGGMKEWHSTGLPVETVPIRPRTD